MLVSSLLGFCLSAVTVSAAASSLGPRDYDKYDYYALHLDSRSDPSDLAKRLGVEYEGPFSAIPDHHTFRARKHDDDIVSVAKRSLQKRDQQDSHWLDDILYSHKAALKPRHWKRGIDDHSFVARHPQKRQGRPKDSSVVRGEEIARALDINDPIWGQQWHLYNPAQPGHDINVTDVWMQGITGENVTVCFIDDGLDMDSLDLKDNFFAAGSYDFNADQPLPRPVLSDDHHGTRCAGQVSAIRNDVCGVGIAWNSKVSGVRILSAPISDHEEALAMNFAMDVNDIYSCSWGPPDDGRSMEAPHLLIKRAMLEGIQQGRDGLGVIYVFAAGNGAAAGDNCNFDGYTNSIYSVTVGAIDRKGLQTYYSEACSALLTVSYSSGSGDAIHTTDVGLNACSASHGGTSAAGPNGAGVYALALSVRPDLTWRDIQWLTVMTSIPVHLDAAGADQHWQNTATGRKFSHQFGYGKTDAWSLIELAKSWQKVKPQAWFFSPWIHVKHPIPEGNNGLVSQFEITQDMLTNANLERLEHVTVTMNVNHTRRGDISVDLQSPSGVISHLSTSRRNDNERAGYVDWTFMSVAHWGENGLGTWTIIVKDNVANNHHTGIFTDWRLRLWGESIDAASQGLLPPPTADDDADHDRIDSPTIGTTLHPGPTDAPNASGNPDDHIDRPVNSKVSSTESATTTGFDSPVTAAPTDNGQPLEQPTATFGFSIEPSASTTAADGTPTTSADTNDSTQDGSDQFLPHPFPTFGVSKKTQIWIYAAFAIIVIFLIGISVYVIRARRRRARASMEDYEFEMLPDDDVGDDDDIDEHGRLMGGEKRQRRRKARELYEPFQTGSEDEDDFAFSDHDDAGVDDEDDDHRDYRDHASGSGSGSGNPEMSEKH